MFYVVVLYAFLREMTENGMGTVFPNSKIIGNAWLVVSPTIISALTSHHSCRSYTSGFHACVHILHVHVREANRMKLKANVCKCSSTAVVLHLALFQNIPQFELH